MFAAGFPSGAWETAKPHTEGKAGAWETVKMQAGFVAVLIGDSITAPNPAQISPGLSLSLSL